MSNDTNTVQTTGMTGLSAEMKTFYDMGAHRRGTGESRP